MLAKNILEIKNLTVFPEKNKKNILVNDVSFSLERGKLTCIVGESGSGKSLTALSIIKLLSSQLKAQGTIYFEKNDLALLNEKKIKRVSWQRDIYDLPRSNDIPESCIYSRVPGR